MVDLGDLKSQEEVCGWWQSGAHSTLRRSIALGAAGAEFADMALPAAVAADKIDHMLKVDPLFFKERPVDLHDGDHRHDSDEPG